MESRVGFFSWLICGWVYLNLPNPRFGGVPIGVMPGLTEVPRRIDDELAGGGGSRFEIRKKRDMCIRCQGFGFFGVMVEMKVLKVFVVFCLFIFENVFSSVSACPFYLVLRCFAFACVCMCSLCVHQCTYIMSIGTIKLEEGRWHNSCILKTSPSSPEVGAPQWFFLMYIPCFLCLWLRYYVYI